MSETTTDRLAEIEGQEHELPKGWQVVPLNEPLRGGDEYHSGLNRYIRRIEPESEPQPVQVREGRWRTRNGDIRNIIPTPGDHSAAGRCSWYDAHYYQTWYPSGRYFLNGEHPLDLVEYLGPSEPEPDRIITPDDVAAEALAGVWDKAKAEQQVEELRSEVSHVQRLLGEEKRRFTELETLTSDLRAVNAAQEKAMKSAARDKADLQHRLDTVAAEWALQAETIRGLQTQLEAVKAELVQVSRDRYLLQIELDAREQVPEAVSDRFDQGFEQGTARAVEMIAEWLEPLRKGNCTLRAAVLFHLPAIMRSLTGLADED